LLDIPPEKYNPTLVLPYTAQFCSLKESSSESDNYDAISSEQWWQWL